MNNKRIAIVASQVRDGISSKETELKLNVNLRKTKIVRFWSELLSLLLFIWVSFSYLNFNLFRSCLFQLYSVCFPLHLTAPLQLSRVLLGRLPLHSTLFACFPCKRRLTIHKWLWPLTPLVHLRPQTPDWLSACTVSLGREREYGVVHFRPGLREVVQTVTATTTFTYAKLVLFLGPCLGIESERDKSTKSQTNPMQQLYPFPRPSHNTLFLGHADILRVGQICSCCLITF